MSEAGREHEQDQRKLAAAYNYAATAHDQAAQMHEKVAEHYDKHSKAARAMHERRMAAQERRSAVADRKWVAALTAGTGGDIGSRSDETDKPERHAADLAALIGATIAVVFTVTNTPGAWGPISTIIGSLLLIVLLAFFWQRRPKVEQRSSSTEQRRNWEKWETFFIGFALSIVVGYVAAIASAQAIQSIWFTDNGNRFECRSVAVEQAATAVRDLTDIYPDTRPLLHQLAGDTLQNGHPPGPFTVYGSTAARALKIDFYDEYDGAIGDCLAGYTFNSLWWIGIPAFLLTFAWWNWDYIKNSTVLSRLDRKNRPSEQRSR
jgi:hypothetical protein